MGSRLDEPLTMTRSSTTYYYNTDGLGSVRQVLNSSGTIVESYDYDPYGQVTIYNSSLTDITSSGSGIDNPYMFTGRRFDEEMGIYHYRARQYDPAIGRFLQRDPIGYFDSMNLYEYVRSNPVNWVDPFGLIGNPYPVVPAGDGSGRGWDGSNIPTDSCPVPYFEEDTSWEDFFDDVKDWLDEPLLGEGITTGDVLEELVIIATIKGAKIPKEVFSNAEKIAQGLRIDKIGKLIDMFGGKIKNWKKMKGWDKRGQEWHWYQNKGKKYGGKKRGEPDPF